MHEAKANTRVAVIGLGYVGCVEAVYLAGQGFSVLGIDVQADRVEGLRAGVIPVDEVGLTGLFEASRERLQFSQSFAGIENCAASLLCVGTPSGADGKLDESALLSAIADVAKHATCDHVVIIRSTVPPGFHERALVVLERCAREPKSISLAYVPEFLREGSALADRTHPVMVPWASLAEKAERIIRELWYAHADKLQKCDVQTVSLLKVVCNAWHATKVAFANEISRVAQACEVDPLELSRLFLLDTKLNLSAAYLRPGMPFGGSCLVKDVAALAELGSQHELELPCISSVLSSNDAHLKYLLERIVAHPLQRDAGVLVVGVGFKPGVSDLRESATLKLCDTLNARGVRVFVVDTQIAHWPEHCAFEVLASVEEGVRKKCLVVAAHPGKRELQELLKLPHEQVLDIGGELSRRQKVASSESLGEARA